MKLHPSIILSADQDERNAFRASLLCKDCIGGRGGTVPVKVFKAYLKSLGVSRATSSRWIKKALELGFMTRFQSKEKDYYRVLSLYDLARRAGCKRLGTPVHVNAKDFAGRSFMRLTWAAYHVQFEGKPVSRATLTALTGVPERTQQDRENKAKVKQIPNYGIYGDYNELSEKNPDLVVGLYDQPGVFVNGSTGELCVQLPNSRSIPDFIQPASLGRTRKVNKLLALLPCDAVAIKQPVTRRYSDSPKQTAHIKSKLRKADGLPVTVTICERWKALPGGAVGWAVC